MNAQYLSLFGVLKRASVSPSRWLPDFVLHISALCFLSQYLCDGAPDCLDAYDEDPRLCTAGQQSKPAHPFLTLVIFCCCQARRPPVEETTNFLKSLLLSHGPDFLEQLFGKRARNYLQVTVAHALLHWNGVKQKYSKNYWYDIVNIYWLKVQQKLLNAGSWRCRQGSHTPFRMSDYWGGNVKTPQNTEMTIAGLWTIP